MVEARAHVGTHLSLFGQEELWTRYANSPQSAVTYTPEGFRAPGVRTEIFYRAGATLQPWPGRPHRVNGYITNKQVLAGTLPDQAQIARFQPGTYLLLELQAFL